MPRKIRELRADVKREGFSLLPKRGKGSHTVWKHPTGVQINIPGQDGDDAKSYMEKQLREAIADARKRVQEQRKTKGH